MVSEGDIRADVLSLPGAYEQASYEGRPSWRTKPRIFASINPEEAALVVWVDSDDEKATLLAGNPDVFLTTQHYDGYAIVLARLKALDEAAATELVTDSWRLRAPRTLVHRWESDRSGPTAPH
jgi:hypothetical protein